MIVGIIMSLIFFILGFVIRSGKGEWLISGYNMLSEEEKNEYDRLAVCKFTGNLLITFAIVFSLIVICNIYLRSPYKNIVTITLIVLGIVIVVGGVIYANTGNRFIKKD